MGIPDQPSNNVADEPQEPVVLIGGRYDGLSASIRVGAKSLVLPTLRGRAAKYDRCEVKGRLMYDGNY